MTLIVCLDDRDGMLFLKRRQSQDSQLRSRVLRLTEGSTLWMNGYSARQFVEPAPHIRVSESPLQMEGFCFAEDVDISAAEPEKLIIYRWNRHYPSDVTFPRRLLEGMTLESRTDFPGSSHEVITEEVYSR